MIFSVILRNLSAEKIISYEFLQDKYIVCIRQGTFTNTYNSRGLPFVYSRFLCGGVATRIYTSCTWPDDIGIKKVRFVY